MEEITTGEYVRQFGGEGSGPGQLSAPIDTATDAAGNVWVADSVHNRIQEFNSKGEFILQFGAKGGANGLFSLPQGIATDAAGNVWVTDKNNNRIQEFNSKGEFIRKFGTDGNGNGQFGRLQGVAFDPEGNVWTVEKGTEGTGKPRVQEFSSTGTYITQFGVEGTANGQFKEPQGIAIDSKGNIWVADTGNRRIQEFNSKGEFTRSIGSEGTGNGQFKSPGEIATDAAGNLWVADSGNNRVQEFSPEGVYISQFGKGGDNNGEFSEPKGLTVDAKGNIWVADTNNNRVQRWQLPSWKSTYLEPFTFNGGGSGPGQLSAPIDTATDAAGNVWVSDSGHNRIQEFTSNGEFIQQFGAKGSANGLLNAPQGIATDAAGNIWVADKGNNRVQEFNSKGEFVRKFGSAGNENGQFGRLQGVAVDSTGNVWTIEMGTEGTGKPRVQEFSSTGTYITQFGKEGSENSQFKEPQGIAIDSKGNIWVADTGNKRIQEFKSSSEFIRKFGTEGTGNGQFKLPREIATDSAGNLWVADSGNNRVQEFSPEGVYISQFGKGGDNNGQFSEPEGLTVDSKGNVWVADTNNNRVEEITTGEYVRQFGGEGSGPGQLSAPIDTATDAAGNVWVSDSVHNRIQEFNSKGEFILQFGAKGGADGLFSLPQGIATDAAGNVWVTDKNNNRIQEFNSKGEFIRKFGTGGNGNGQFGRLQGVAFDPAGNVWTVEKGTEGTGKPRVQEFSSTGTYITQFGVEGTANGQFKEPQGIAVDSKGNIWVSDTGNRRIQEFNSKGEFTRSIGSEGTGNGQFKSPGEIATDAAGNLWVADSGNNRVQEFSPEGVYISQFGKGGDNNGEFSEPKGLTVDAKGNIWVADTNNNRVEEITTGEYVRQFGGEGSGPGQLSAPIDTATDAAGNVWVSDSGHNRIQEFTSNGEYAQQFGAKGSANGLLNSPQGIAIDSAGNIWVADKGNNRVQEFNSEGEYVRKFGVAGIGNGQFGRLQGVAVDSIGNVWTIEMGTEGTGKPRVQKFSSTGTYITQFGVEGTANGQFKEPQGIAVDSKGNLWVADSGNNRIQEFNSKGEYVYKFGTGGSEEGQLSQPTGITADKENNVWVADTGNNRIEEFSSEGIYLRQFGSAGNNDDQLSEPRGIATDASGNLSVADTANNRIEGWLQTSLPKGPPPAQPDPQVEVKTSSGFVSSVEGEATGKTTYSHTGEILTSVAGLEGKTNYEYDGAKRLKKVTLPDGTWGEVKYDPMGRVTSVTVSIKGAKAKTTGFEYSNEPRETVVTFETDPAVHYQIGADGSVFKWWNSKVPPEIEELTGSLWVQRGEVNPEPITPGDQELHVHAHSVEGIVSIQIVANGSQLVTEKTCEESKCVNLEKTMVTETENWPPGVLQLEVIVKDRFSQTSSVRFWVNIPYTPPPNPEELEPPKFDDILRFREEFGLDLDIKGNESATIERIFGLIADWHDPNSSAGKVARASMERWGVPLRTVDIAELEYREAYLEQDASAIPLWASEHAHATYAGYYVDNRAGGTVHVGFTSNQTASVEAMRPALSAAGVAATNRIEPYPVVPARSLPSLGQMVLAITEQPGAGTIRGVFVDEAHDRLTVAAENVPAAEGWIASQFGGAAPVSFSPYVWHGVSDRWTTKGVLMAGSGIASQFHEAGELFNDICTAGFGAVEKVAGLSRHFLLTAGHCANSQSDVWGRLDGRHSPTLKRIGTMRRNALEHKVDGFATDGAAIALEGVAPPRTIFPDTGEAPVRITGTTVAAKGTAVCSSGAVSAHTHHGNVQDNDNYTGFTQVPKKENKLGEVEEWWPYTYQAITSLYVVSGDSGGPVWQCGTGKAIGLVGSANGHGLTGVSTLQPPVYPQSEGILYPLEFHRDQAPGILGATSMGSINLTTGG